MTTGVLARDAALAADEVLAFVALGANLGDARSAVLDAMGWLGELPQTRELVRSSLYRSAPHEASGPDFFNAVMALATRLSAPELLQALHRLEHQGGRQRPYRNAPRTLDLDLLLHGDTRSDSPTLQLPHPRMWQRAFVLLPLAEIAPQLVSGAQLRAVAEQAIERLNS